MILAIVYLIIGFLAAILVFSNRPKIEIPKSKEFEQIEKEIKGWLEIPLTPIKKEIQMTTAFDTGLERHPLEKPVTATPVLAFERTEKLQTVGQVT